MTAQKSLAAVVTTALLAVFAISMPTSIAGADYVIQEGDALQITVWKNAELSGPVTVRPDGKITMPLVNDVMAGGFTVEQLRKVLAAKLGAFVNGPNVSVTVVQATGYRVYTLGALASNGVVQLSGPLTAIQLLARAGGAAPNADLSAAYIIRSEERVHIDLTAIMEGGGAADQNLLPGDVLVVPVREEKEEKRILVVGEVAAPKSVIFREGMTALDAFAEAGGGNQYADLDGAKVLRSLANGKKESIQVDLEKIMKKSALQENITLLPGDILVVP